MTEIQWSALSQTEQDLMICALEGTGMLAFAGNEDDHGTVLSLVDRGWVTVHRIGPWTAPDGQRGITYGPALARDDISEILATPDTWDAHNSYLWYGAVTLWLTPAGWAASHKAGAIPPPSEYFEPPTWTEPDSIVDGWLTD